MSGESLTTRERIASILKRAERPLTADEIARAIGLRASPNEIYEHLAHIAKSIQARSKGRELLLMEPPYCKKCGFVFRDLDKPKKPSKCPRCKGEWIMPPRFIVIERQPY